MFQKFTMEARRVVALANEESRRLNHSYIGTEHLLLGILLLGSGIPRIVLERIGVVIEELRDQVGALVGEGEQPPEGHIPFTPRAKRVLELAHIESIELGVDYIGSEHLLLALMRDGEGVAAQALGINGVEYHVAKRLVAELTAAGEGRTAPAERIGFRHEIPIFGTGRPVLLVGASMVFLLAALVGAQLAPSPNTLTDVGLVLVMIGVIAAAVAVTARFEVPNKAHRVGTIAAVTGTAAFGTAAILFDLAGLLG